MMSFDWHSVAVKHPGLLLLGVFLVAFAESLAFVGLVVPGVVALVLLAGAAQWAGVSVWLLLAAGFLGALIGDVLSFHWGARKREGIWEAPYLARYQPWLLRGAAFFERWGWASILVGRFVGPVRPVVPVVAGVLGMPARRFWLVDLLACLGWAPVYLLPGYWAGQAVSLVPHLSWPLLWLLLAWVATMVALALALSRVRNLESPLVWVVLLVILGLCCLGVVYDWWSVATVHEAIVEARVAALDPYVSLLTHCGDTVIVAAYGLCVALILRAYFSVRLAFDWLCQLAIGGMVFWVAKRVFAIPRPDAALLLDPAFPSGHTWMSMLIAFGLVMWIPWPQGLVRRQVVACAVILAGSIAFSRLYLGVHWWTDVLASILGALLQASIARQYVFREVVNLKGALIGASARNLALFLAAAWLVCSVVVLIGFSFSGFDVMAG